MDLVRPEAELTRSDGTWVTIRADRGRYNEETGKLLLIGHVNLFHDRGYEFLTDEAHVDTRLGNAWGDLPVTGQGPLGELFGSGFRLYDNGRTVVVTGRAHLNLVSGDSGPVADSGSLAGSGPFAEPGPEVAP
jgi:lipopolysaccharide export system protein LptC